MSHGAFLAAQIVADVLEVIADILGAIFIPTTYLHTQRRAGAARSLQELAGGARQVAHKQNFLFGLSVESLRKELCLETCCVR